LIDDQYPKGKKTQQEKKLKGIKPEQSKKASKCKNR